MVPDPFNNQHLHSSSLIFIIIGPRPEKSPRCPGVPFLGVATLPFRLQRLEALLHRGLGSAAPAVRGGPPAGRRHPGANSPRAENMVVITLMVKMLENGGKNCGYRLDGYLIVIEK